MDTIYNIMRIILDIITVFDPIAIYDPLDIL